MPFRKLTLMSRAVIMIQYFCRNVNKKRKEHRDLIYIHANLKNTRKQNKFNKEINNKIR